MTKETPNPNVDSIAIYHNYVNTFNKLKKSLKEISLSAFLT